MSRQPIGTLPSKGDPDLSRQFSRLGYKKAYTISEINLMGVGDILLLFSDGFSEHMNDFGERFAERRLEEILRRQKGDSAQSIFGTLMEELQGFATPDDDVTLVVIKRVE